MYPDCKNQMSNQTHTAVAMETKETSEIQVPHRLQNICRPGHSINTKIGMVVARCCSCNLMEAFFDQLIILTVMVSQSFRLVHIFMKIWFYHIQNCAEFF